MKPLYLIACSNAKLGHAAPAAELYQGQAFKLAMKAAERAGADVIILSALHGAVSPTRQLQPYNRALTDMSTHQRAVWAAMTEQQLQQHKGRAITVLAGVRLGKIREQLQELDPEGRRELEREARTDYAERAALMLDDA